jgi:gamma-glutamylcyclotransferase (GGCT)/AIG2-like uncharacterized protein YtfP
MQNLFVYGTLLSSEIIEKLTGKTFETAHAVLEGYKMYCVKDCDYPTIVIEEGAETKGKILADVDDSDLKILSVYEGDEYAEKKVKVLCINKYEDALTFVWSKELHLLENRDWDFEDFQKNRLKFYLDELE